MVSAFISSLDFEENALPEYNVKYLDSMSIPWKYVCQILLDMDLWDLLELTYRPIYSGNKPAC